MKVARRAAVPPFAVMEILAEVTRRTAAGESVLNLCVGEPATGASDAVRDLAAELLAVGDLGYTDPLGSPALRRAIAGHYARWYDVDVDPARVAVTTGSSGGFLLAFLAAFDVGDRVALARPGYPAYRNILTSLGCEVLEFECGPETSYRPTVDRLAALHAASPFEGLVLASPANPTGTMLPAADLDEIALWCAERGVRLISDEIYQGIVFDPAAWPGATAVHHLDRGAVVVNSFSKYWAMTGWRLGWLVLPDDLIEPVDALAGNVALCPPSLAQHAGVAAFSEAGYAAAAANVERYTRSRELLLANRERLGWHRIAPADGAFYLYADVSGSGLDSITWCERLLAEAGVALTPGSDFDDRLGHRWVRLSFAQAPETIAEAIERIAAWRHTRQEDDA